MSSFGFKGIEEGAFNFEQEDEMILFFPDGLHVMIIDDDAKAVRRATAMLSTYSLSHPPFIAPPGQSSSHSRYRV
uniref:Uncharacterized protein n=1 Tax=Oryza glumipatula TaxID=40148 RepID=A0A0E0AWA1_9ORYZ